MSGFFKELFKDASKQVKSPQVLGLVIVLVSIYRFVLPNEFDSLKSSMISGLWKFSFLISLVSVFALFLLFTSVIVFIISAMYMTIQE